MEIKILQVFYDKNGLPYKDKERQVHFPIVGNAFQGASNTTKIRFYYDELDMDNETTFVAVSKLPNGKIGSKILNNFLDEELNENYALLELDSFYTQANGDLFISLQGYQGGVRIEQDEQGIYQIYGTPTIQATGSIKLSINYATQFVGSGEEENVTLQRIFAYLGTKLGIRATTELVSELPTVGQTDVFYAIYNDPQDANKLNIYVWNETTQEYVWVGDNTLDLGDYYKKQEGEEFEQGIDARVSSVENELSSVASGSPKGVYSTLTDLESAYPTGTDGIYVVSANGHWYYWNGSAWADGGVYQATETPINSIQLAQLQSDISDNFESVNLFDATKIVSGGYYGSTGNIEVNASSYYSTQYIKVKYGTYYRFSQYGVAAYPISTYDANGNFLERINVSTQDVTFSSNVSYIRISYYQHAFPNNFMFCVREEYPAEYTPYNLKVKVTANEINGFDGKVISCVSNNGQEMENITNVSMPEYCVFHENCYAGSLGERQNDTNFDSFELTALTDFDIWTNTITGYVSICIYNSPTWEQTNFITRYRTTDDNLPTSENKLTVHKGQCIVISYAKTYSNFNFYVDGLLKCLVFKDIFCLNEKQINQIGLNKINVTKSGDNFNIKMGKYTFPFNKFNNTGTNLDSYDIASVICNGTTIESGNILGVIKESGQDDFMGGDAHGDEIMISMDIYGDGTPITNNIIVDKVDIYLISNLKRVSDHTTNVFKRFVHIIFENNKMIIETTFKCLVNNFNCQVAYVGMWGQYTSQISKIFNNVDEYDTNNYESITFERDLLKFTSYVGSNGIVTINYKEGYKDNSSYARYVYYTDSYRLKTYLAIASDKTINENDELYGKSVYEFS